jgi:hypothetical protein
MPGLQFATTLKTQGILLNWPQRCAYAEVLLTCLTHAMTTEAEEIMGLLLGDITVGGRMLLCQSCGCHPHLADIALG